MLVLLERHLPDHNEEDLFQEEKIDPFIDYSFSKNTPKTNTICKSKALMHSTYLKQTHH
jgi:hypothetical protein